MILHSDMTIPQDGCYEFDLESDDGSMLWINGEELINNDGGHKMKSKRDTSNLRLGTYKAKMWYYQGMPDKLGLIFKAKYIGDSDSCSKHPFFWRRKNKNIYASIVTFYVRSI